ncbi:unnamed protein product [Dicrocoelium dendriticum]|nr:unnamed protein product [Dicrocoelium dendriticum]
MAGVRKTTNTFGWIHLLIRLCVDHNGVLAIDDGVDTGTEAVMNLAVASAGKGAFVITLEGTHCVEYLAGLHKVSDAADQEVKQPQTEHGEVHVRRRKGGNGDCVQDCPSKAVIASPETVIQVPQRWELTKLRTFPIPPIYDTLSQSASQNKHDSGTGLLTCVAIGGRAGSLVAIGTDLGRVFLIDRHAKPASSANSPVWTPFIFYPNVSVGSSAGVCSLSLTTSSDAPATISSPLLATVCGQPSWSRLSVWRTDCVHGDEACSCADLTSRHLPIPPDRHSGCSLEPDGRLSDFSSKICSSCRARLFPYAMASCSGSIRCSASRSASLDLKTSGSSSNEGDSYRFKHCQFLRATCAVASNFLPEAEGDHTAYVLATTVQPLRATRSSVSRLVVWLVPIICQPDNAREIHLPLLTEVRLPRGHLPACLTSHPDPQRPLIGVGTMEGRVDVYFLSFLERSLTRVYSMDNAHPIFVTALAFLPVSSKSHTGSDTQLSDKSPLHCNSFELVTVSVDRAIRWHSGPSYLRVGRLIHGLRDPDIYSRCNNFGRSLVISSARLATILSFPILLALFDTILAWVL